MSEGLISPRGCERLRAVNWSDAASRDEVAGLARTVLANTEGRHDRTLESLACRNLTHLQHTSPSTIREVGERVAALVDAVVTPRPEHNLPAPVFRHDAGGGFLGQRRATLFEVRDGFHHMLIADFEFPTGEVLPYVVAWEEHDGGGDARIMALPTAIHLIQNVGEAEAFQIGNREGRLEDCLLTQRVALEEVR